MRISKQGADFIKSFEGCRLEAYHGDADRPGLYTIGYGHTDKDTIGINRKLLGARTQKFMCLKHLAEFFGTTEEVLQFRIEDLKDSGCPLFR